jgi:hypothetical protein
MKEQKAGTKKKTTIKASSTKKATKETKPKVSTDASNAASKSETATKSQSAAEASAPSQPTTDREPQLPLTNGKLGVFGGPRDRGIKTDDKLALPTGNHGVYERVRSLNPSSFYCAMRWNYHVEHMTPEEVKRWWANKKLLVTNPKSGTSVVVRAVDYGPHENTGFAISVSPGAAEALGAEVGDEVEIAMADAKSQLGKQEK